MNQNSVFKDSAGSGVSGMEFSQNDKILGETVGQKLFRARDGLPVSDLEKISADLCIRPHLLMALEQDDFNKFPSACYAAGFLKNYAAYLGLNVAQIGAQYKKDFIGSTKKVDLVFLEEEKKHTHGQQMIISMVLLTALVLYGVWYSMRAKDGMLLSSLPDMSEVTSDILAKAIGDKQKTLPENTETAEGLAEVTVLAITRATQEKDQGFNLVQKVNASPVDLETESRDFMAGQADQVKLSVREDAWIRIIDTDREILVDRILLAGEEFSLTNRKGLTLMTGNAGALSILVGDIVVSSLGRRGEIRDRISLDRNDLLINTARLSP